MSATQARGQAPFSESHQDIQISVNEAILIAASVEGSSRAHWRTRCLLVLDCDLLFHFWVNDAWEAIHQKDVLGKVKAGDVPSDLISLGLSTFVFCAGC